MPRYIDAEKLIQRFQQILEDFEGCARIVQDCFVAAIKVTNEQPDAFGTGEWIDEEGVPPCCSWCGGYSNEATNYCPNCRADLTGLKIQNENTEGDEVFELDN